MLEKLMPRSDDFFDDFERQASATVEGTKLFKALLEDFVEVPAKVKAIKDVEHRADDITHRAFERLHTQFITPFDRSEIHRLLSRIDDVLDLTDAASERLGLYQIGSVIPEARELAEVLVAAAERMQEAVRGLRNIKDAKTILDACKQINVLENQGDTLIRRALAKLFNTAQFDALTVMKWKEILDLIEDAIDRTEDVANVIEGVVLQHA
jgi:predicted phosphate transport protein (TIGR00153 family)